MLANGGSTCCSPWALRAWPWACRSLQSMMHDDANPVHLNALSVFLVLGAHAGPGVVPVPMELVPVESTSKEKRPGRGERKVSVSLVPAAVTGPPGQRQAGSWVLRAVGERRSSLRTTRPYLLLRPLDSPRE
jgi:hypothetical protein